MSVTTTVEVPPTRGVVGAVHQYLADHDRVRRAVGDRGQTNIDAMTAEKAVHAIDIRRITMIGPTTGHAVDVDGRKCVAGTIA